MARAYFPSAEGRSVTAVADQADYHEENLYSAVCLAHGAANRAQLFMQGTGSPLPQLKGSTITATANPHQMTYSDLTTNIEKAGEVGSNLGDIAITTIGITIEPNALTGAGAARTFGATPFEMVEILHKCTAELKVGRKRSIIGPAWSFPNLGGFAGAGGQTGTSSPGYGSNGVWPIGRRVKFPIMAGRNDTLSVEWAVQDSGGLAFSTTTSYGLPTLVWVNLYVDVQGDVR
jgi:hypothetical protein